MPAGPAAEHVHGSSGDAAGQVLVNLRLERLPGAGGAVECDQVAERTLREAAVPDVRALVRDERVVDLHQVASVQFHLERVVHAGDRGLPVRQAVEVLGDHGVEAVVDVILCHSVLGEGKCTYKDWTSGAAEVVLVLRKLGCTVQDQEEDYVGLELELAVGLVLQLILDNIVIVLVLQHVEGEGDVEGMTAGQELTVDVDVVPSDGNDNGFPK
ncbi:uncharacterized protein PG986_011692 [Apiospora aurea]|uniref:Uncharacterized protein n=1 Tax=Apiospora aurea TaxID=335848 RepID=A0ABR1PY86_9PEZI